MNTLSPYTIFTLDTPFAFSLTELSLHTKVPPALLSSSSSLSTLKTELSRYRSPETQRLSPKHLTPQSLHSSAVYTAGLLMAELFTGQPVYPQASPARAASLASSGTRLDLSAVSLLSPEFAVILRSATATAPTARTSLSRLRIELLPYLPSEENLPLEDTAEPSEVQEDQS